MVEGEQREEYLFTCQNDSCKRSFIKPLKVYDIRGNLGKVYEACPFCLSKIEAVGESASDPSDEKNSLLSEEAVACVHYLGYLCERSEKDRIPDECMLCANIVSCMLHSLQK